MYISTRLIVFLGCATALVGCTQPSQKAVSDKLDEKAEPYEQFALQRSYPDRSFDWQGWHHALTELRADAQVAGALRSPCEGNATAWTLQGPGNVAGRCNALAVKPDDENTVLAGFSAGGIFKSTDGTTNWRPVFDDKLELAIGDIVFDPNNPNVVYAGTGDPNLPSIAFVGDGLYKSTDAGETWQYLGLRETAVISKVVIDPTDSQKIYVAAMGNPHERNSDRGIYKTTDGGQTWQRVLFVSNQAGASSLVIDPQNPNILYASFWERIRNNYESVLYGKDAKIFKTTNGGQTWTQLVHGLPNKAMGRTGLVISQQNPEKLYAVYVDTLSKPGGVFKTTDGGENWTALPIGTLAQAYASFGWYFGKLSLNPKNDEDLYFHAILLYNKAPNSTAWVPAAGGHADSHDLEFTPSGRRYWSNDGGVYRNNPGQLGFAKSKNLPTTQFYHTDFNPLSPNLYYGGAQDNGIQRGNAATYNDWVSLLSADGFNSLFHPTDPNTYWLEIQDGAIYKTTDGGQTWQITPACLGSGDRCNWDMPLFQSTHNRMKFMAGTHRVYFNLDGGGWSAISGDLTDGNLLGDNFHNISCLNESPLYENRLIAGTSDGNVWRYNGTNTWTNITAGLPNRYVTSVHYSPFNPNRLYVTHSGFRDNENIPHIHRSDNNGQTWINMTGDLPRLPVNDLWVMPGHADTIAFAATDGGVYYTRNSGRNWLRLGTGIPYVPVFDLEHNPVRRELMAATFARGIYTFPLDSVMSQMPPARYQVGGTVATESGTKVWGVSFSGRPGLETGVDGKFALSNQLGCQNVTFTPQRDDAPLNGVTTLDLALISKHILGVERFTSPYKQIAADANRSGTVTTFDIVTLRKIILGIDSAFLNNTSWRFVPKSYVFPNPDNPFEPPFPESLTVPLETQSISDADFVAIKIGDVNGSVTPRGPALETRSTMPLLGMPEMRFVPEQMLTVPLHLDRSAADIAGLQFSLRFDPRLLEFQGFDLEPGGLSQEHCSAYRAKQGVLTFCYEPPLGRATALPLVSLRFRAKGNSTLSRTIGVGDMPTPALAYFLDGHAVRPNLTWLQSANPVALKCYPNPFGNGGVWLETTAGQTLEQVAIMDAQGRKIYQTGPLEERQPVRIPAEVFPSPGVYWYVGRGKGKVVKGKVVYVGG